MKFIDYLLTYTALKYKNQHIHTQTSGASLFCNNSHNGGLHQDKNSYMYCTCTIHYITSVVKDAMSFVTDDFNIDTLQHSLTDKLLLQILYMHCHSQNIHVCMYLY